jgi:GNAT superfamily N-acetyltransferase
MTGADSASSVRWGRARNGWVTRPHGNLTEVTRSLRRLAEALAVAGPARAQFVDRFDGPSIPLDPEALDGWSFFTGDGEATIDLRTDGQGHASVVVDATRDRRNIWWALIKRRVSEPLDLALLRRVEEEPGARAHFTISRPVLQRLVDGRTLGLAVRPLGAVVASFFRQYQKKGHGKRLIQACLDDAREARMKGVATVARERPWLASRALFVKNGLEVVDTAPPDYELLVKKLDPSAPTPFAVFAVIYDGELLADHHISARRFGTLMDRALARRSGQTGRSEAARSGRGRLRPGDAVAPSRHRSTGATSCPKPSPREPGSAPTKCSTASERAAWVRSIGPATPVSAGRWPSRCCIRTIPSCCAGSTGRPGPRPP